MFTVGASDIDAPIDTFTAGFIYFSTPHESMCRKYNFGSNRGHKS